jgi:hypothetical protein
MRAETIFTVDQLRQQHLDRLELDLKEDELDGEGMQKLHGVLELYRGGSIAVSIHYQRADGECGRMRLSSEWNVRPQQELFESLSELVGSERLRFEYNISAIRSGPPKKERPRRQYAMA